MDGDGGAEVGAEGERLNVSTWLVIQSDYHRLTAPTGRHPRLLSLPSPLPLQSARECKRETQTDRLASVRVCVCVMMGWVSSGWAPDRQTDTAPTPSPPSLPRVQGAHPGCSVQDDPLCGGDSWWRLQPAELWLDTGRMERSVNCQFNSRRKSTHTLKNPNWLFSLGFT